ncbi:hypothetical protein LAZ67_22002415 [Cordylochernes scorpioides]|uniref:Uncharacterized protein n=1 Tax=Cordylochernes scorpioides TaxID=51811 RepID=A0ABY6LUD5_9ARAC|nr:hypothetical protein LAZ67_22002415 [Cordylochernes scorpioides]
MHHRQQRTDIFRQLLETHGTIVYLVTAVTNDGLHEVKSCHPSPVKKGIILVWWNFEDVLHFELVPNGRSVDADMCCEQLEHQVDGEIEIIDSPQIMPGHIRKGRRGRSLQRLMALKYSHTTALMPSDYGPFDGTWHFGDVDTVDGAVCLLQSRVPWTVACS